MKICSRGETEMENKSGKQIHQEKCSQAKINQNNNQFFACIFRLNKLIKLKRQASLDSLNELQLHNEWTQTFKGIENLHVTWLVKKSKKLSNETKLTFKAQKLRRLDIIRVVCQGSWAHEVPIFLLQDFFRLSPAITNCIFIKTAQNGLLSLRTKLTNI